MPMGAIGKNYVINFGLLVHRIMSKPEPGWESEVNPLSYLSDEKTD